MDRTHLAKLYETEQYADCTILSARGHKFRAHRFVLSQYPLLTESSEGDNNCVRLSESTEVTERLLRWMYGVNWPKITIQPTRAGVGAELMEVLSLCDAAEKVSSSHSVPLNEVETTADFNAQYNIPKLGDDAYNAVGAVLRQLCPVISAKEARSDPPGAGRRYYGAVDTTRAGATQHACGQRSVCGGTMGGAGGQAVHRRGEKGVPAPRAGRLATRPPTSPSIQTEDPYLLASVRCKCGPTACR